MLRSAHCGALVAALTLPLLIGCAAAPAASQPAAASQLSQSVAPARATAGVERTAALSRSTPGSASGTTGCANAKHTIPRGARTTRVNDVDGDGKRDTAFFTTSKPYVFGFKTSAGGIYTTPDRGPVKGAHHAWAVNTDGFPATRSQSMTAWRHTC